MSKKHKPLTENQRKVKAKRKFEKQKMQYGLSHAKYRIEQTGRKIHYRNGPVKIVYSEELGIDNRNPLEMDAKL